MAQTALKELQRPVRVPGNRIDKVAELRDRLQFFLDNGGYTQDIAKATGWPNVSQFINGGLTTSPSDQFYRDMDVFLRTKGRMEVAYQNPEYCRTSIARAGEALLINTKEKGELAVFAGEAGIGKTLISDEGVRKLKAWKFTCNLTMRTVGSLIYVLGNRTRVPTNARSTIILENIIERLRGRDQLMIFDESHLLRWEVFETLRTIYDGTGCGIVFMGQPRLIDEMKGANRDLLWDQLFSRIGVSYRFRGDIPRTDCELILEKICPGLDTKIIDYLHGVAQGPGHFRTMSKLVKNTKLIASEEGQKLSLELFKEVYELSSINK